MTYISANAQPSILMCNHPQKKKKKKKKKNDRELLVENGFIIHNKCRNVKHTIQLKQLTL